MKELVFDVMLHGKFIRTLRMPYCPIFKLKQEDITNFVESKIPSLKGKDYNIAI